MDGSIQKIHPCPCFDNPAEAAASAGPQAGLRGQPG